MTDKEKRLRALLEPSDYFKGMGNTLFPVPTNVLLFRRTTKDKLQQAALQNRSHHRYVLIFNYETQGHIHVNNQMLSFSPGQSLLIFPYQFHHFSQLESDNLNWLFCTFELPETTFFEPLRNRVVETTAGTVGIRDELLKWWLYCAKAVSVLEEESAQLQTILLQLLLGLKKDQWISSSDHPPEPHQNLLRNINRCMSEWRGRPVGIGDLSDRLNISESRLRARFKESAGLSLGLYLRNYRLNRAMSLLRRSTLSIAEVAEEAGFGSPQAFSRIFKKEVGVSPRKYRL